MNTESDWTPTKVEGLQWAHLMSKKQLDEIEFAHRKILDPFGLRQGDGEEPRYEYKRFEIYIRPYYRMSMKTYEREIKGVYVTLITQAGMLNDEGTWAGIICRETRLISIGPRGGVRLINGEKSRVTGSRAYFYPTRY